MILKQIAVFLENRQGQLAPVVRQLADRGINLRALSLAETDRFGILRLIADDTEGALAAVRELGVTAKTSEVIAVEVPDRPGGLADLLDLFDGTEVNLDYMYAELAGRDGRAMMIMKLDPPEVALAKLTAAGLR